VTISLRCSRGNLLSSCQSLISQGRFLPIKINIHSDPRVANHQLMYTYMFSFLPSVLHTTSILLNPSTSFFFYCLCCDMFFTPDPLSLPRIDRHVLVDHLLLAPTTYHLLANLLPSCLYSVLRPCPSSPSPGILFPVLPHTDINRNVSRA
jgi:hypothetical protein